MSVPRRQHCLPGLVFRWPLNFIVDEEDRDSCSIWVLHFRQAFAKEAASHNSNSFATGFAIVDRLFVTETSAFGYDFYIFFPQRQNNRTTKILKQCTHWLKIDIF